MKTEAELFENALDTTSVNGKKLREYINENYISNSVLDEIRAEIKEVQTYKMFEGEDTVYVERKDVLAIIDRYAKDGE